MAAYSNDHVQKTYDAQFDLPGYIWNLYIFEQVELQESQDLTECGVKCELHDYQCDFFVFDSPTTCYFGLYSQVDGDFINVPSDLTTYHKTSIFMLIPIF